LNVIEAILLFGFEMPHFVWVATHCLRARWRPEDPTGGIVHLVGLFARGGLEGGWLVLASAQATKCATKFLVKAPTKLLKWRLSPGTCNLGDGSTFSS